MFLYYSLGSQGGTLFLRHSVVFLVLTINMLKKSEDYLFKVCFLKLFDIVPSYSCFWIFGILLTIFYS